MSGIDSDLIRGHIDTIILKSLYHGDKYGLEIIQEVEEKSGGTYELKQPTLYSCLKRLETQGLISSYWEDSDIGGKRHYYKLTDLGRETYQKNQDEWLRSRAIIDNLIYNTTVNYAPIADNDADAPVQQEQSNTQPNTEEVVEQAEESVQQENKSQNEDEFFEEPADNQFASYNANSNATDSSFFDSNSETSSKEESEEDDDSAPSDYVANQEHELVNLDLDNLEPENLESDKDEEPLESQSNYYSATNVFEDEDTSELSLEEHADEIYAAEEESTNSDDEIYQVKPDYVEDNSEAEDDKQTETEEAPTYINFDNNNTEEADITNLSEPEYIDEEPATEISEANKQEPASPSIEETANAINEQYYSAPTPHASEEEINKLYQHTENYENLQAGYTDEAYKQALNELEAYGGGSVATSYAKKDKSAILSFDDLKADLEKDGITIAKHERQLKESDDSKLYVKANQINMIKNWMVWGCVSAVLLVIFGIMSAFRSTYTYNFAFWEFVVAMAVALILPVYSTIRYAINPYRKTTAKFAPRLSILINLLITVQLIVITYCVNLQCGFYSFSQENYNHLLWILPLVLSFIPVLQSVVYMLLFNSKKFHV